MSLVTTRRASADSCSSVGSASSAVSTWHAGSCSSCWPIVAAAAPSPQQALAAVLVGPPLEGYALDNILAGESRWVILDGLHSDPPVPLTVSAADRDTRLARARQAGVDAQRKLNRELRYLPRTPRLRGEAARRACFVVLQAAPAHPAAVGFRAGAYDSVAGYVCTNGRISGRALFHGFATVEEAAAYWSGSGREQPWPLLEPFRA